jgi:uncharacterized protein (DUF924 family)
MPIMRPRDVLSFWFEHHTQWFNGDAEFDEIIRTRFGALYQGALAGDLDAWRETPEGVLALVILYDQFSRNMFRGTPFMYQSDSQALALTKLALDKGWDQQLSNNQERQFLYMPLMHSENSEDQNRSVALFSQTGFEHILPYAEEHREAIVTFGRFPYRNQILGRVSTQEEWDQMTSDS